MPGLSDGQKLTIRSKASVLDVKNDEEFEDKTRTLKEFYKKKPKIERRKENKVNRTILPINWIFKSREFKENVGAFIISKKFLIIITPTYFNNLNFHMPIMIFFFSLIAELFSLCFNMVELFLQL